jgi:glutaminyl-tRNA synthetase
VRLYDRLFAGPDPDAGEDFVAHLKPASLAVLPGALVEPSLAAAAPGARYQFERQGYFCLDPDSAPGRLVFNRTVTLKDGWARLQSKT